MNRVKTAHDARRASLASRTTADAVPPASDLATTVPVSARAASNLDALALAAAALLALGMIQRAQPLMALAWLALAVLALVVLVAGWVPGQGADSTGEDWDTW